MKLRYVVVDDAPFIRDLVKSLMSSAGHVCVGEAGDAKEASEAVARALPDVTFVDLVMPRRNGIAIARDLRDLWPEGKLIACTTMARDELPDPEAAAAFDGWIEKPFTKESVESALKRCFGDRVEANHE